MDFKKYGMWGLVVLTFAFKHGSYVAKAVMSLLAGQAVSTVIVAPVSKYISGEGEGESKQESPEVINQTLELQAMKAFRDLDRQGIEQTVHDAAVMHLQDLAKNHSGIFARASREYFNSQEEAKKFCSKYSIAC